MRLPSPENDKQARQKRRMERAITTAFIQLVEEKGYEPVTVGEITERADVGRTTFYRYFQNKSHILVHLHSKRFENLKIAPSTREDWLSGEAPQEFIDLLKRAQHQGRFKSMMYKLGFDIAYIQHLIEETLAQHFAAKLQESFSDDEMKTPMPIVSRSLAGMFSWMVKWWVQDPPEYTPEEMANHVYSLMASIVREAVIAGDEHHIVNQ